MQQLSHRIIPLITHRWLGLARESLLSATVAFAVVAATVLVPRISQAQFLKIGPLTFAAPDGKSGIVLIPSDGEQAGIFLFTDPRGNNAQGMNPVTTPGEIAASAFISFNPVSNAYDQLVIGEQRVKLQGSVTLKMGTIRIQIDPIAPYISVVTGEPERPIIIGISGVEPVLNKAGIEAATLFEGNQFSDAGTQPVLPTFTIEPGPLLKLEGEPFSGPRIGIPTTIQNVCVDTPGVLIAEGGALEATATPLTSPKKLDRFLRIVTASDWIAVLDFDSGKLGIIRAVPGSSPLSCAFKESAS